MSYSFTITAATKEAAKQLVAAEFDKVVGNQSIHSTDREQAQTAANAFIDILPDDESKHVSVSAHGSVSWSGDMSAANITSASVSVTASLLTP